MNAKIDTSVEDLKQVVHRQGLVMEKMNAKIDTSVEDLKQVVHRQGLMMEKMNAKIDTSVGDLKKVQHRQGLMMEDMDTKLDTILEIVGSAVLKTEKIDPLVEKSNALDSRLRIVETTLRKHLQGKKPHH